MHVEGATRLAAAPHEEARELLRVLGRFRWRLGLERGLVFALRGAMLSAVVLAALSVVEWLTHAPIPLGVAALPLVGALALAVARWPSMQQAARQADRRLALAERLGTAVELAGRPSAGRFDRLQVHDAVAAARAARTRWLALDGSLRRDALAALVLVCLALGSRVLVDLPRPQLADVVPGASDSAAPPPAGTDGLAPADAPDALSAPPPAAPAVTASAPASSSPPANADLATRVQQGQAERRALDQLSNALGQVSAGKPAADAIQRGDFSAAHDELNRLGEEADQLSDAAKQQLGQALQSAASASSADRQLADRERQAGQALARGGYAEQRQALEQLGQQLEQSGTRSVTSDQLARELGQLQQQQQQQQQQQSSAAGTQGSGSSQRGSGGAQNGQAGGSSSGGQGGPGSQPGQSGQGGQGSGGSGDGQQGGPGAGTGAGGDPLGDPNPRLATAGQRVEVPPKLGQGPGVRPTDGSEDQASTNPSAGARSVSESAVPQQTGQLAPEQNLVPGEQRPVVRGYFR